MRGLALLLLSSIAFAGDPIITLDYTGGSSPPRVRKEPYLAIFEDGEIRACNPYLEDEPRADRISKDAVRKLVKELGPKIAPLEKQPKEAAGIEDACVTVLSVGKRTAKQYALGYLATKLPGHERLQALRSAEKRLDLVWKVTMVGGKAKAEAILKCANEALKKQWPKAKPFSLDDLSVLREAALFRRQADKRWIAITVKDGKASFEKGG